MQFTNFTSDFLLDFCMCEMGPAHDPLGVHGNNEAETPELGTWKPRACRVSLTYLAYLRDPGVAGALPQHTQCKSNIIKLYQYREILVQ